MPFSSPPSLPRSPVLERRLTLLDSTFFEVGGIIGAGVFVLLGLATGASGPAIVLAVILAGIVSFLTALSYAEISSAIPLEGGDYAFAYTLFSRNVGALVGAGWIVADTISSAIVALGFATYFTLLASVSLKLAAVGAVAAVTFINILGVKLGTRTNNLISFLKIAVLAVFILLALPHVNSANFTPLLPKGWFGVLTGASLFFFAFSGFGKISRLGGEVISPKKNLPKAILIGLALSTVLYMLAAIALVGSVGWLTASSTNSPLSTALISLGMPSLALLIALGALAATLSVLLTNNLGSSRMLYALSEKHPRLHWLTHLSKRFATPWKAVLLTGTASALLVLFLDLTQIVGLSSFLFLAYYAVINFFALAARKRKDWKPSFSTPLHPILPILGLLSCLLLMGALLAGVH